MLNMETIEPKSHSWWWDSHISNENFEWLSKNRQGADQRVKDIKQLLNLIVDGSSSEINPEVYYQKKPELIAHVEEFYCMHHLLAKRYDDLIGELRNNTASLLQTQHKGISDSGSYQVSPLRTPDQKHKSEPAIESELYVSSGGGSSDISLKGGYETSSSSSDSDSESFESLLNKNSFPLVKDDSKGQRQKLLETGKEENVWVAKQEKADETLEVGGDRDPEKLLKSITEYNEELREAKEKVQSSEEEIVRLKSELQKNEPGIVLMGDLMAQPESAQCDIQMKGADLDVERRMVLELQKQVSALKNQVLDSNGIIKTLQKELEITREKHKGAEEPDLSNKKIDCAHQLQDQLESAQKVVSLLEAKLVSEESIVLQLKGQIKRYVVDVSDRDTEIRELKAAFCDAQQNFSLEKSQLQSDIASLSEQQNLLWTSIEEWKLRCKSLENETSRFEAEKKETKSLHEAEQMSWQCDIERLKTEVNERSEQKEVLCKKLDMLKLEYNMLMAEKDGVSAMANTLSAELCCRNDQIREMGHQLSQMHLQHEANKAVLGTIEGARERTNALYLRAEELEKEVDKQRVEISERTEEKREAIRQLCFSLEHYRSRYRELCQAYNELKRYAGLGL
ncbi:unnamed protein product [Ilex paraguariensis]|uniref:NAB domain-containing protein n=1 Tax=Ilex paraguariensis TaxID=185542 RepID=A0ABC8QVE6_9AQUA